MGSFGYLFRHTAKNRIKKALKRPTTYIFGILIVLYLIMMVSGFGTIFENMGVSRPRHLAQLLSLLTILLLPSNVISYSRRKGLLFKPADVHLMFPAPISPKAILLYVGMKNLLINVVLALVVAVFGVLYFHVPLWQVLVYVIVFVVMENVLEGSMIVLCYGNERLPELFFKILPVVMYALMGILVLVGVVVFCREASFGAIGTYLTHPVVQMVPVVGWNIAFIQLIFIGPTTVNVICTLLFVAATLALFLLAYRAKCVGEYFEDAAKFADDYAELKNARKRGEMTNAFRMGKKQKFKEATVTYKGSYAKAIFYRQLLEYKKNRFFIFGFFTLVCLVVGIGMAVVAAMTDVGENETMRIFLIPGVMAYIIFIFSGYTTKWSKELENPYTYLIPDNVLRKIWYSTKMEHIRSFIDGLLMTVPGAVVLGLNILQVILIVLLYVCLQANKLYYFMLADMLVGKSLGDTGRSMVKLFLQMLAIGISASAAVVAGIFGGIMVGFGVMVAVTFIVTFIGAALAAGSFEKMEVA